MIMIMDMIVIVFTISKSCCNHYSPCKLVSN